MNRLYRFIRTEIDNFSSNLIPTVQDLLVSLGELLYVSDVESIRSIHIAVRLFRSNQKLVRYIFDAQNYLRIDVKSHHQ